MQVRVLSSVLKCNGIEEKVIISNVVKKKSASTTLGDNNDLDLVSKTDVVEDGADFVKIKSIISGSSLASMLKNEWKDFGKRVVKEAKRGVPGSKKFSVYRDIAPYDETLKNEFSSRYGDFQMEEMLSRITIDRFSGKIFDDVIDYKCVSHQVIEGIQWNFDGVMPKDVYDTTSETQLDTTKLYISFELVVEFIDYSKLPAPDTISVTEYTSDPTKKDAVKELEQQASNTPKPTKCDPRPAQMGDTVVADIRISGAIPVQEMKDRYIVLGQSTFAPDLQNRLVGKSAGESISYDFSISKNKEMIPAAAQNIKGSILVSAKIKEVMSTSRYEFNEEFARLGARFSNTEDMIEYQQSQLCKSVPLLSYFITTCDIKNQIATAKLKIPSRMFKSNCDTIKEQYRKMLASSGKTLEEEPQFKNGNFDKKLEEFVQLKVTFEEFMKKFIEDNNIELGAVEYSDVEQRELNAVTSRYSEIMNMTQGEQDSKELVKMIREDPEFQKRVRRETRERKVINKIINKAKDSGKHSVESVTYDKLLKKHKEAVEQVTFNPFVEENATNNTSKPVAANEDSTPDKKPKKSTSNKQNLDKPPKKSTSNKQNLDKPPSKPPSEKSRTIKESPEKSSK